MSPQRGLFQAMCGDDGQDDNDDDNGDHDDADDDDDTLSPLVSPPDRASFELPRAPDIGSCKPPFQCDSKDQHHHCPRHIGR